MDFSKGPMTIGDGFQGQKWTILGEPYVPLHMTPSSLLMHAEFGPDSFVPTHLHETQDETLYILEGEMEFELEGKTIKAAAGTTVTLPMGIPHALHNRSGKTARALVFVSPTGKMYDYMARIDGLSDPAEVVRLGAEHEIRFV
ncbi:cupin domain-containing protein [Stappia indica]|uniref:cupin domain-containing protein n=1 Tax=Stappia indica TaxID=538381 RepID=UPI001CD5E7AA|nr:cupin domain-containing protein [Stappia indica]MCA1297400.1 cupin domain-containing protein [Stappia indica]